MGKQIKLFGKELTWAELSVGAFIQFPFYYLVGWWVLALMPISALLWAWGGADGTSKAWRRWGVSSATAGFVVGFNPSLIWMLAFIPAGWGVLTIGYGIPDSSDEGSFLGRLFMGLLKNNKMTDFAVRVTTYVLYWVVFLASFAVINLIQN